MSMSAIFDLLEYIPGVSNIFSSIQDILGIAGFITPLLVISGIVLWLAGYIFDSFTFMLIGKKAGLDKDWMPFIPVARSLYRLYIVRQPWWFIFFFDSIAKAVCTFALFFLFNFINMTFAFIMVILFSLCCYAYYIYYMFNLYRSFGIHYSLIISILGGRAGVINTILYVLIGYTNLFSYGDQYGMEGFRVNHDPTPVPGGRAPIKAPSPPPKSSGKPGGGTSIGFTGSVTCLSGMYSGNTFNMVADEEMIIGRDANVCNIVLDRNADKVSRKHCGIMYNSATQNYYVTDYSSNGTLTREGARLVNNIPTQLPAGTVICLGNNENRFMLN